MLHGRYDWRWWKNLKRQPRGTPHRPRFQFPDSKSVGIVSQRWSKVFTVLVFVTMSACSITNVISDRSSICSSCSSSNNNNNNFNIATSIAGVVVVSATRTFTIRNNHYDRRRIPNQQFYDVPNRNTDRNTANNGNGWVTQTTQLVPRGGSDGDGDGDIPNEDVLHTTILRIRMIDGTIHKVSLLPDQWQTFTLYDIIHGLKLFIPPNDNQQSYNITLPDGTLSTYSNAEPSNPESIRYASLNDLGLKHGSLVSISQNNDVALLSKRRTPATATKGKAKKRFDPYPELAKEYDNAVRAAKIRRNTGGMTTYATIAALQSSLHTVEPQSIGTIQRMYMCHVAAAQFQTSSRNLNSAFTTQSTPDDPVTAPKCHIALLLGTITTERKDMNQPKKARTSLSSTIEEDQYCQVARVHAIWEPSSSQSQLLTLSDRTTKLTSSDDLSILLHHLSSTEKNVIRVANYLGLQPIGWIFSYTNDRVLTDSTSDNNNVGGLPVWGPEVEIGARLQIECMKQFCYATNNTSKNDSISQFGTLAMDARTGATEAFQLSDEAVQMVAEDMFLFDDGNDAVCFKSDGDGRYITTRHPVIIDGKETTQLDSVLCLVNVALLSHTGMFTGSISSSSSSLSSTKKKRDGKITKKIRKAIIKAIEHEDSDSDDDGSNSSKVFKLISDFSVLLSLDDMLTEKDSELLCKTLYKWARGQKKSVKLDQHLKETLRRVLNSTM